MTRPRKTTSPPRRAKEVEYHTGYNAMGYYKSSMIATTDGLSWSSGSGDAMLNVDRPTMVSVSRHFYRNNPIYKGMIDRSAAYIVGNGFGLQVRSNSESYNSQVELLWSDFMEDPEVRGIHLGHAFDRMLCTEVLQTGETINLKTDTGKVQIIESEQLCGKSFRTDGITKDKYGRPKSFTVYRYSNLGSLDTKSAREVSSENVMFIANRDRPSATRGVPPLQSTFSNLHRINDVCDSEAIAWQLLARMALAVNRQEGAFQAYTESKSGTTAEGTLAQRVVDIGSALIFHANPGETIQGIERNIPGQNFPEALRMFLRLLGLPFGLPLELILLDWTKSNFSQSRAVLEQVYRTFLFWQSLLETGFYRQCLKWKIDEWVAEGALKARAKDGYKHEWIKPTFPWINLLEEAKAHGEKIERSMTTLTAVCKGLNTDRSEVCQTRQIEITDAIRRSQQIEDETGEKVPWQLFAGVTIKPGEQPVNPDSTEQLEKTDKDKQDDSQSSDPDR